jgi:hypothetical protein
VTKLLATVALTLAAIAGLVLLGKGLSPGWGAAAAIATLAAVVLLARLRRRDPRDFDVVLAIGGLFLVFAYGGMVLNGPARAQPFALALVALSAAAALFGVVDLVRLRLVRGGPPDLLATRYRRDELVETEGIQWAVRPPSRPVGPSGNDTFELALQNTWDAERNVTAHLALPRGFEAGTAQLILRPLEVGILQVPIVARPGARAGKARAWLAVRLDDGRRLRHRRYREIAPRPPTSVRALSLLLALRNPIELLLALAEPAVRFRLEVAPDVPAADDGRPRRAIPVAWWIPWEDPPRTRAAQSAAAFRRR